MTFDERIKQFQNIYENTGKSNSASLLIPDVYEDSYFKEQKPKQKLYTCKTYDRIKSISRSELYDALNKLVKENVSKMPIFTYRKRKEKFIEDNKDNVEAELKQKLEILEDKKQKEFEEKELSKKKEKDELYKKEYEKELAEYNNFFNPSQEWLENKYKEYSKYIHVTKWKGIFPLCSGSAVYIEKDSTGKNRYTCSVLLDSPTEYFDNNLYKYSITSAGNLSKREKTDKELEEEYAQNVCAMAFIYAIMLFNICFDTKEVLVNAHIKHIDRTTGNEHDRCLYSVIVPRDLVKSYKMENLDSVEALLSLEGNADIKKGREIYFVEPLLWRLDQDDTVSTNVSETRL